MEFLTNQWLAMGNHVAVILINIVLLVYSRAIVNFFKTNEESGFQLLVFRLVNYLFILSQLLDLVLSLFTYDYHNVFASLGYSLLVIYIGVFAFSVVSYLVRKKFGKEREIDGSTYFMDTYNSRLIDIFLIVLIGCVLLYLLIVIWGMTSLFETTGFLGILIAFLALTHGIWAADPYYCMVILGSEMIEDGDTVQLDDDPDVYIISRVTFIYTILYDIRNNHRTMIRNSKLIESKIENLSKRTSPDGLRHAVVYKIGYPEIQTDSVEGREAALQGFFKRIEAMFAQAYERALQDEGCRINANVAFEWLLGATGDDALEFSLIYYLEPLPNTKLTKKIRAYLYQTPSSINRYVYEAAVVQGLSLATPDLVSVEMSRP